MKSEFVVFNKIRFNRYPESKNPSDRNYFRPHARHISRGIGHLHQEIWKSHHGPIPEGMHIHHRDLNPLNNDISNLELLTPKEHRKHHPIRDMAKQLRHLEEVRPLAAPWHSSEEGLKLHRANGEKIASKIRDMEPRSAVCEVCGRGFEFKSFHEVVRFCSAACRQKDRRNHGLHKEMATCEGCGQQFERTKYMGITRCKACRRKR